MNMDEGYRIPTIEEFVDGFEFEVVDWTVPTRVKKVWHPMQLIYVATNFFMIKPKGSILSYVNPFDVESYLKQGLIRVKI